MAGWTYLLMLAVSAVGVLRPMAMWAPIATVGAGVATAEALILDGYMTAGLMLIPIVTAVAFSVMKIQELRLARQRMKIFDNG